MRTIVPYHSAPRGTRANSSKRGRDDMPIDLSGLGESFAARVRRDPTGGDRARPARRADAGPDRLPADRRRPAAAGGRRARGRAVLGLLRLPLDQRAARRPIAITAAMARDATPEIEVILDMPIGRAGHVRRPGRIAVRGARRHGRCRVDDRAGAGVPVMADPSDWSTGVPVGPGTADHTGRRPGRRRGWRVAAALRMPETASAENPVARLS